MSSLWNCFASRAHADPKAPALLFADRTISFGELHQMALRYAGALVARDIKRGDVIALQLAKRSSTFGLLLACLRLGAPYVFIDPKNPPERSARIMQRVRPAILFTASDTLNPYGQTVRQPSDDAAWFDQNTSMLPERTRDITGTDPAYIMFTSGSTGEPKGAVIPHQGVLSLMRWARSAVSGGPRECFTNVNPLHFDNSVFDIYCSMFNGGALAPIETGEITNPAEWVKAVRRISATVMFAVPTFFLILDQLGLLTPDTLPSVRTFVFGGEGYPLGQLRSFQSRFIGRARLINVYGPTETSCICSSIEIADTHLRAGDDEFPPLGRMHQNFSYMLLDNEQRSVPKGEAGELWIGGPCVGLGYYGNDEETVARFRQDPRQNQYRSIYYRSGDLVREDDEGKLWFRGRVDNQVKLRGYRIELEEVDLALQSIPDVRRAVTVVLAGADGGELAVAFMADRAVADDEVRELCERKLPAYMRPSVVVQLSELPQNANGKIDRGTIKALLERRRS